MRCVLIAFGLLVAVGAGGGAAAGQCVMDWADGFAAPGTAGGFEDVLALTVFDDGGGPALYVGGRFRTVGETIAKRIAKWDGTNWSPLGEGLSSSVQALVVFDDGSGPALYAGCNTGGVRKWDGSSWTYVGLGSRIHALAVFDDGSGPALYAGIEESGQFTGGIFKWDGASWSEVGGGMYSPGASPAVFSLAVHDDGSGPALYVGGNFIKAGGSGGITAYGIARWDGQDWSSVGGGVNNRVRALTVHDDGGGPALYAGGEFTYSGGMHTNCIAKWDGTSWSALGTGLEGPTWQEVYAVAAFDDGSGPALYVGGRFEFASQLSVNHIAKWNGTSWSALGAGMQGYVKALATYDDGRGSALYVGGRFFVADGVAAHNVARWDGSEFSALAAGNGVGFVGGVAALEVFDDGTGSALYVGGDFHTVGDLVTHGIARWDGSAWSTVGLPSEHSYNDYVGDMLVFDDGSGPALYAGGYFGEIGGVESPGVARWDGTSWSATGELPRYAVALVVFDDGSGPALYAAGQFDDAPGLGNIAKWDGSVWSPLGDGLNDLVNALAVFDDGSGPALYAGGAFWASGSTELWRIGKWDGSVWSPLGTGIADRVYALTTYDDGSGPALYAGGGFDEAGGVEVDGVARWDGSVWSPVGSGIGAALDFAVFDDGSGSALYAGNGHLSKWDGVEWSPVGPGPTGGIWALAPFEDNGAPALYAGGSFTTVPGRVSAGVARLGCLNNLVLGDANCDGVVDRFDIDAFVLALVDPDAYEGVYADCDMRTADVNYDGSINAFDIDPFVELLT